MASLLLNPSFWAGLVALTYATLGACVLLVSGSVLLKGHFLLLSAAGIVWGVMLALPGHAGLLQGFTDLTYVEEVLLLFAWYALVHRLLQGPYGQSMPEVVKRLLRLFWVVIIGSSIMVIWVAAVEVASWQDTLFSVGIAGISLTALALAAQLNRDAPVEARSALRALVAAAALASSSQAVLALVAAASSGTSRPLIGAAALVLVAAGLLLIFALRLRPQWSLAIFVSPEARSYAPRFLATGSLLLLILLLLPVFRTMNPEVARQATLLLVLGIGAPLVALLFSEQLSARLRVFVSKHFLPFRYDYREEWLRLIDTLVTSESKSPLPERIIKAVAQIVGSPAGVLWTKGPEGNVYTPTASWNTRTLPRARIASDDPALRFMLERQWTIDTAELARRPELYGGLRRPDWVEAFPDGLLIVPLISNDALIGLIVLFQSSSVFRLTFEEIDLLRTSGRQVAAFLAQYEADQKLAEGQQFEAFNRLTAFVMHDLKNLIAQQSLMLTNAAKHKGNPAFFEDAMATVTNSVARMNKLLQQLQAGDSSGSRQRVRIGTAVADAVERCRVREPVPEFHDEAGDLHVWIDREKLTAVVAHLVRNAQESTTRSGQVSVTVSADNGEVAISIEDDGCGMESEFIRTRLFRPFDTTKGSKGMGIGAYQARSFVMDAGGTIRVDSEPGKGTRFCISLPAHDG